MDVFARFHPLVLVGYYVVAFSLLLTIGHPLLFALTPVFFSNAFCAIAAGRYTTESAHTFV